MEDRLEHWPVARLATVGDDAQPHTVPIVFARVDGVVWSPVDGKPKAGGSLVRVRNAALRPRASLLLDSYESDWTRLWWIRVDGILEVVQPADPERDPRTAPVLAALRRKYPQYAEVPVLRDPPTLLALRPARVRCWCAHSP